MHTETLSQSSTSEYHTVVTGVPVRVAVISEVVVAPVHLLQLQELLDSLDRDPGLHEAIHHPGKGIQRTDEYIEQCHTCEYLNKRDHVHWQFCNQDLGKMESPGIDPGSSRMLS